MALRIFPDPVKGTYKDPTWQTLGEELQSLLSPEDYDSAKRTTFYAFYTSAQVTTAMHRALSQLGVPENALVLEPGCGTGTFMVEAPEAMRFIGVELDRTSGRIARALHPNHDIRIEDFQDTRLPEGSIDAVIGNVPFADIKLRHRGKRFSLHDYFFAKSVDALKPGGILALVTSRFTLDKTNGSIREYLGERADFVGAIRLPSDAFKQQGTAVVSDIVFLRKRKPGARAQYEDASWLETAPLTIEGSKIYINCYFLNHPEMVLGDWSRENRLYSDGFSIRSNGDLVCQLEAATAHLPVFAAEPPLTVKDEPAPQRFARPPPVQHITTGSFFVRKEDRIICQVTDTRTATPVTHGKRQLVADGSKMGERLSALISLRDAARLVLQSQNEGWPKSERDSTRQTLNWIYDRFVRDYGPINKTTFGETKRGTAIRRMPNLVRFREDPDAMLVMSLEEYDEVTETATKAAILREDVVFRKPPVTEVRSAEEGLLVSLDHRGGVDLPYIAELYDRPEDQVIAELGDLIYRNPETKAWETADVYLSGNVRIKLAAAISAGAEYQHNADALRAVQPPDVLPGDIDANLGAPWIPVKYIERFAADLFGVAPCSIQIGHLRKDATWCVDADYAAERSVAATSQYGTERAGGPRLFELALNMKSPVIYDTIRGSDGEQRVINQEETVAAREKQRLIKAKFRQWVFDDPDRTEHLVRIYNDTYNNLRLRIFDGSHLQFPGMNQTISLRPHQKDAIWRAMSSGNALLAHAVGAGKTFVMAATGMKLKEASLVSKPMYVVPNHMLEQFSREFMQLYPNARLLIATKDDMARDRRKYLTAKIATGQWDGIIVTHSSFERIGMSRGCRERFLRAQVAEYEQLLCDTAASDTRRAYRNLIKTIEKQKASREQQLKALSAEEKKDDGLVFDELGVDHIFIDESHYFKNLETPTKMQRVAGIQTGGSQRAFDLYMKARYLDEQHLGHGVTFATGTPISNTMVEMYTLQRFLDLRGLTERGIEHFDGWAATFGEVVETTEVSPDGASMRPRSRFARFNNLPELQQMFRRFSDVQTQEMLDLPRPLLHGGKPTIVACPMSDEQSQLQQELVKRYDRLRSTRVDPRADNALAITTDGRKLALDARMLSEDAKDYPESKVNALARKLHQLWKATTNIRGTQLVFCDLGIKATPWGFSVYDNLTHKLTQLGIPREQIAAMGDAQTDAKKQSLFDRVRQGAVRVLIGSTQKMGTGTNVQKHLIALHHLDAPWKPAEVEQREGRILRQGNENKKVAIYRYVTEGSFDAFMWQALETKARFIGQVMTGDNAVRRADDIGGQELSYAEVKAIASGNPAVLTLAEADAELKRLAVLKKNHTDQQFLSRRKRRELPATIARLTSQIENLQTDSETLNAHRDDRIVVGRRTCHHDEITSELGRALESLPQNVTRTTRSVLGEFRGLSFGIILYPHLRAEVFLEGATVRKTSLFRENAGPRAVLNALDRLAGSYAQEVQAAEADVSLAIRQLRDYEARGDSPFIHEHYSSQLSSYRDQLKDALSARPPETDGEQLSISELVCSMTELQAAHAVEATPRRASAERVTTEEEPVTTRARRRIESKESQALPITASAISKWIHDTNLQQQGLDTNMISAHPEYV